jgi:hypothetical protein
MMPCSTCIHSDKDEFDDPCYSCNESNNKWVSKINLQRSIEMKDVIGFIPSGNTIAPPQYDPKTVAFNQGVKYDSGKAQWSLMQWKALSQVVDVLTYGAKKYSPDNWKKVPNARQRYIDAGFRHFAAYAGGEKNDSETGLSHLAHAMCCMLFLLSFDLGEDK